MDDETFEIIKAGAPDGPPSYSRGTTDGRDL
jgi:hypothetical protein